MRYSAEHKEQSRAKILEAARQFFRSQGFEGASIDEVMNAAGLTRGAFYAHFDSKDDLVRHVLGMEAGLVDSIRVTSRASDPKAALVTTLSEYLDPTQREDIAAGCPLVAHPVDAIRGDSIRKQGYTERLKALIDSVEDAMGGEEAHDDAVLVSVLTIGAGLLSSASADPRLADEIDEICLKKIGEVVGTSTSP